MRVLILGGTGHIGHSLTQHYANDGAEVIVAARGQTATISPDGRENRAAFWDRVRMISLDRAVAERRVDASGRTEWQAMLNAVRADLVIDLIAYHLESVRQTIEAIRGTARHYIVIGTGWRFGAPRSLPTREDDPALPQSDYGREKQAIRELLLSEFQTNGFAGTQIDPPAIQGAPKIPNCPTGLRLLEVHQEIADGKEIIIPGTGETLLGLVHVADVAQMVILAAAQRDRAAGEAFNAAGDSGMTYNGLFEFTRELFGSRATASHLSLDEFEKHHPQRTSRHHTLYHQLLSNEKSKRVLGFRPQWDSREALVDGFRYLVNTGRLRGKI